ncbi:MULTISPECIES: tRNA (adenosine(37)-N6)-threonylcarbamoyltransferase complex ATPase subunit type 1 TsaE [Micromonospora]|nr:MULTISPECIES: tRNA (adenosine(37)-N6)-threonylcarbamoyltransferase complex ATPase subunit type 1 TsaE [Micromonospora]RUL93765.1 tRNA (adenosine(37)-N6)-threonylcarbamoyltransferase complex ATPase subunit type 1 TsaE [Verrucosispora sp. FIM060022]
MMASLEYVAKSLSETHALAAALAPCLSAGDAVLLRGDLGAGKTAFVQALADSLGCTDEVTSPTFTLANFYRGTETTVLHVDTYRLSSVAEYRDLGLADYADECVTLVEWGDLVSGEFPCHLRVEIASQPGSEVRTFTLSSECQRWQPVLQELERRITQAVK